MLNDFLKYIWENKLASRKDRILLAVSGGIDSMTMAHLFSKAGFIAGIAHCNFSLRGNDADLDEELVRQFASGLGFEFHVIRFDTKEYASRRKISIQMAARELRYAWFEKLRQEHNYRSTAVAHNLNDNVETILINLVRGTGITGLTGMSPSGNGIIRPLLFASRERIGEYCSANGIAYREDRTNAETKYMRNKIRHLIIPVLRELNPSVEESITATSERLNGTLEILTGYIESLKKSLIREKGENIVFNIPGIKSVSPSASLIFELFREYGISGATSGDLLRVINGRSGGRILTPTHRIIRSRDELIITKLESVTTGEYRIEEIHGFSSLPFITSAQIIDNEQDLKFSGSRAIAWLDYEKIIFPVLFRRWKKGDLFYPFGMKQPKKLSDYFIDRKYSVPDKEKALILESGGEIVWIVGERIDDRFRVDESTSLILRLECK